MPTTTEILILTVLARHYSGPHQIAAITDQNRVTVQRAMEQLRRRGMIEYIPNNPEIDARRKPVQITKQGRIALRNFVELMTHAAHWTV